MWTIAEIAKHIKGIVHGNASHQVVSVATLQSAQNDQLSFLSNVKYAKYLAESNAGVVIVAENQLANVPHHAIVVADPYIAYAKAATLLNQEKNGQSGVHPSVVMGEDCRLDSTALISAQVVIGCNVEIGANVIIGPGCVLFDEVKIGPNSRLIANVTICKDVSISHNVLIHPGTVIGADGFGFANDQGSWIKVPQVGSVKIGNNVEIGANTTIDRGAIEDTVIGNGVKIDNQVHIAHNVIIGNHTIIAGCVGIAGSTTIGAYCGIAGAVSIAGHLQICDKVQITGMSMVTKSISEAGVYSSGLPAEPTERWHRNVVRYRQMDKLTARVKKLEVDYKDINIS